MRVEVTGCHTAQTETGAVDVVAGYHCIDRTEVELTGMFLAARFHEVLNQGFRSEDDVLEAGNLFDTVHEYVHRALLLGERHLAHFRPILVALGKHVRLLDDISFQAEEAGFYLCELIVAVLGGPLYFQALDAFHKVQFHGHVVIGQHPVSVGQLFELLHDVEVFHEVDTRLLGQVHGTFLHGIGGVLHHVEVPRETEVLRVLRNESQMHALLLVHHECVHQIVLVEADGSATDGADEAALQQPDVVVVDVDVGEYVRKDGPQHVSGVEELFDTSGVHAFDDGLFALGAFTENGLARRLLDGDG